MEFYYFHCCPTTFNHRCSDKSGSHSSTDEPLWKFCHFLHSEWGQELRSTSLRAKIIHNFMHFFYFLSFTEPLCLFTYQYGTSKIQLPKGFVVFSFNAALKDAPSQRFAAYLSWSMECLEMQPDQAGSSLGSLYTYDFHKLYTIYFETLDEYETADNKSLTWMFSSIWRQLWPVDAVMLIGIRFCCRSFASQAADFILVNLRVKPFRIPPCRRKISPASYRNDVFSMFFLATSSLRCFWDETRKMNFRYNRRNMGGKKNI